MPISQPAPAPSRTIKTAKSAGRDAADPACLGQIDRAHAGELFSGLGPQMRRPWRNRNRPGFAARPAAAAGGCRSLAGRCSPHTLRRRSPAGPPRAERGQARQPRHEVSQVDSGRRSSLGQRECPRTRVVSSIAPPRQSPTSCPAKPLPAIASRPAPARWPSGRQTAIGIVLPQQQRYSARLVNMR